MNEIAAYMVLSLMTRSRGGWDERMYRHTQADGTGPNGNPFVCRLGPSPGLAPSEVPGPPAAAARGSTQGPEGEPNLRG
jgi:hypothetical protein